MAPISRRPIAVNALPNFLAGALQIIGFDPFVDPVDFLERRVDGVGEARPMQRAS
jgi:hypothetical protein